MRPTHGPKTWMTTAALVISGAAACPGESPGVTTAADTSTPSETTTAPGASDSDGSSNSGDFAITTGSSSGSISSTLTTDTSSSSGVEVSPECGNGKLDPGEECDDGDDNASYNACTGLCTLNVCGDGMRFDGVEACDLGNANGDADQCNSCVADSCTLGPHCGDNILDIACGELCDGEESPNDLPCAPTCRFDDAKLVFLTPDAYMGDLRAYTEHEVQDGIDAADWICHELALGAGLFDPPADDEPPLDAPKYRAWLSSAMKPVAQRLNTSHEGIYVERDGAVIAHGWDGLISGLLLNGITAGPEPEQSLSDVAVWTNTRSDGTLNQPNLSCINWMYDQGGFGGIGFSGNAEPWTYVPGGAGQRPCNYKSRLYCIEQ